MVSYPVYRKWFVTLLADNAIHILIKIVFPSFLDQAETVLNRKNVMNVQLSVSIGHN